jgi:hypothetical protein
MKKYVIGHEEQCLFICKTRTDAEEIVLSIVEEDIYEDWYINNCTNIWWGDKSNLTPAEYIAEHGKNYQKISACAWSLYSFSTAYWIDEVEELD